MRKEETHMMDMQEITMKAQRLHSMIKMMATGIDALTETAVIDPVDLAPALDQLEEMARDLREAMEVALADFHRVEGG